MKRVSLGCGSWFNPDAAILFDEHSWWDGRNFISQATGSQWEHEALYRTAKGSWVLKEWSDWQGTSDRYSVVSDDEAYAWLLQNNHSKAVEKYFSDRLESSEV